MKKSKTYKVKLLLCEERYDEEYFDVIARQGISDWEELTEDEYTLLRQNLYLIKPRYGHNSIIRVVVQDDTSVHDHLLNIKQELKKIAEQRAKEEEDRLRRKKEREAKRKQKALETVAKNVNDKRALLEKLKEELGEK